MNPKEYKALNDLLNDLRVIAHLAPEKVPNPNRNDMIANIAVDHARAALRAWENACK